MNISFKTVQKIYDRLGDSTSKKIFSSMLMFNATKDVFWLDEMEELCQMDLRKRMRNELSKHKQEDKIIFGCGSEGIKTLRSFPDVAWQCFIDNSTNTLERNLPVKSVEEFLNNYKGEFIVVSSSKYYKEMYQQLVTRGIPREQIFLWGEYINKPLEKQYFDLPALHFSPNEVFVDVGAFDGNTSLSFVQMVNYSYKHIYAFEPHQPNVECCKNKLSKLPNVTIYQKGVWDEDAFLSFCGNNIVDPSVQLLESNEDNNVSVIKLDSILSQVPVTFIKMDIEGGELRAIRGARKIISEQHPKLAIALYHKPCDLMELPLEILSINKDYKLYIRRYSYDYSECVLYAV